MASQFSSPALGPADPDILVHLSPPRNRHGHLEHRSPFSKFMDQLSPLVKLGGNGRPKPSPRVDPGSASMTPFTRTAANIGSAGFNSLTPGLLHLPLPGLSPYIGPDLLGCTYGDESGGGGGDGGSDSAPFASQRVLNFNDGGDGMGGMGGMGGGGSQQPPSLTAGVKDFSGSRPRLDSLAPGGAFDDFDDFGLHDGPGLALGVETRGVSGRHVRRAAASRRRASVPSLHDGDDDDDDDDDDSMRRHRGGGDADAAAPSGSGRRDASARRGIIHDDDDDDDDDDDEDVGVDVGDGGGDDGMDADDGGDSVGVGRRDSVSEAEEASRGAAASGRAAPSPGARSRRLYTTPTGRPSLRVYEDTPGVIRRPNPCNCKKSKCLKLYCECFASNRVCSDACNCTGCCNQHESDPVRRKAVTATLERNKNAFRPKLLVEEEPYRVPSLPQLDTGAPRPASVNHAKGCHCKKSGCLKKYCECFQANITCGPNCKCLGCQNCDGNARLMDIRMMASSSRGKSKRSAATPTPTPALVPLDSVDGVDAATAAMLRPVRMSARHRQGTGAPATPSPVRPATTGRAVTAGALAGLRGDADVDVDGGADADATPSRRARASAAAAAARGDVDVGSAAGAGGADDGDGGSEPDDASGDSDVFLPTKAPRKRVRDRSKERARARSRVRNRSGKKAPAKAGAAQQHAVAEASLQLAIRHTQLYPDLQLQNAVLPRRRPLDNHPQPWPRGLDAHRSFGPLNARVPDRAVTAVFAYMTNDELYNVSLVCTAWAALAMEADIWDWDGVECHSQTVVPSTALAVHPGLAPPHSAFSTPVATVRQGSLQPTPPGLLVLPASDAADPSAADAERRPARRQRNK